MAAVLINDLFGTSMVVHSVYNEIYKNTGFLAWYEESLVTCIDIGSTEHIQFELKM